jgi:hypothetical protein
VFAFDQFGDAASHQKAAAMLRDRSGYGRPMRF